MTTGTTTTDTTTTGTTTAGTTTIAVALKWVDLRPEVDPLTGEASFDARTAGASDADRAALEMALRIGERWRRQVVALTVGPPGADAVLRTALAAGAARAVRVEAGSGLDSWAVASGLAGAVAACQAGLVICGDWSLDRGSGSVPPFLAAELDWAQACGIVSVEMADLERAGATDEVGLWVERRLDAGRRERLVVRERAVVSVEGAVARLRRETLSGLLAAAHSGIEAVSAPSRATTRPAHVHPFRPRARILQGPNPQWAARERILSLTGTRASRMPPQRLVLDPDQAAKKILSQLEDWRRSDDPSY